MSAQIFVVGSFVVDCVYRSVRMPIAGETLLGTGFELGPGGKGSNQAVAAARAGATVALQTAVGEDTFGGVGWALWRENVIDTAHVRTVEAPTGSAAILLDEASGANRIIVVPGACSSLMPKDVDAAAEAICAAKVLMVQLEVPIDTVARALEIARGAGVITVLNPAPAPLTELPEGLLSNVDYLVPNETEATILTGVTVDEATSAQKAIHHLQQKGAANVVLTMGEQGAWFLDRAGRFTPVRPFRFGAVQDTTGAGDAFCGAFAAALANGAGPAEALQFASAGAALSVLQPGAAKSMPQRAAIDAALRQAGVSW